MPLPFVLILAQATTTPPTPEAATALAETTAYVRMRGFACDNPREAVPDPEASRPDERAWILTCESGRYRVTFTGDTGAIVPPRDPQALASAIRELASEERNTYGERSRRARARIVEQFSLERSVSRWSESYAALLALPASRSLPSQKIS